MGCPRLSSSSLFSRVLGLALVSEGCHVSLAREGYWLMTECKLPYGWLLSLIFSCLFAPRMKSCFEFPALIHMVAYWIGGAVSDPPHVGLNRRRPRPPPPDQAEGGSCYRVIYSNPTALPCGMKCVRGSKAEAVGNWQTDSVHQGNLATRGKRDSSSALLESYLAWADGDLGLQDYNDVSRFTGYVVCYRDSGGLQKRG